MADIETGPAVFASLVLFFDRDVGISLPRALGVLKLPTRVEHHQDHFPIDARDDDWMPRVGGMGWTLIGHDSRHHREESELLAIRQHDIGCFYLWGGTALRWEKMRCFLRAYENILAASATTPRPFIHRVTEKGRLIPVTIP